LSMMVRRTPDAAVSRVHGTKNDNKRPRLGIRLITPLWKTRG
jgi:hypothetical protein